MTVARRIMGSRYKWTPTVLGSQVVSWIDASDHTTCFPASIFSGSVVPTTSQNVVTFYDFQGNAWTNSAGTSSPPTWNPNGLATGYPAFYGQTTSSAYPVCSALNTGLAGLSALSCYVMVKNQSTTYQQYIQIYVHGNAGPGGNTRLVYMVNGAKTVIEYTPTDSSTFLNNVSGTATITDTTYIFGFAVQFGVNMSSYINGVVDINTTPTYNGYSLPSTTAGNTRTAGSSPNPITAEMILLNSVLSTTDQQKMEGYLAWKWNQSGLLSTSHPYKYFAPTTSEYENDNYCRRKSGLFAPERLAA